MLSVFKNVIQPKILPFPGRFVVLASVTTGTGTNDVCRPIATAFSQWHKMVNIIDIVYKFFEAVIAFPVLPRKLDINIFLGMKANGSHFGGAIVPDVGCTALPHSAFEAFSGEDCAILDKDSVAVPVIEIQRMNAITLFVFCAILTINVIIMLFSGLVSFLTALGFIFPVTLFFFPQAAHNLTSASTFFIGVFPIATALFFQKNLVIFFFVLLSLLAFANTTKRIEIFCAAFIFSFAEKFRGFWQCLITGGTNSNGAIHAFYPNAAIRNLEQAGRWIFPAFHPVGLAYPPIIQGKEG